MKRFLFYALIFLVSTAAIFSLLGSLGGGNWIFDLLSHFKPQYLVILILGTAIIFKFKKRLALIFVPFIAITIIEVIPMYFGGNKNLHTVSSTKIVCINLLSSNRQFEDVEQYIVAKSPDIIVLQEFNTLWQVMLEPKLKDYEYRLTVPRDDNFGIAVYSKVSISNFQALQIGNSGVPSISGNFQLNNSSITLLATHPLPPMGKDRFEQRNLQLSALGKLASEIENEVILIGDLNTSSFSLHFKKLIETSGLIDSRKGFGLLTTWPTWLPVVQTTLDHCLVSKGLSVKRREVGHNIGSDHLPIFIEVGL